MAYTTQTRLLKKIDEETLIQLTDDDDTGVIIDDIVDEMIAAGDAEIDGYCGKRYPVPFATVPPIIAAHADTIAIKNLYARRRGAPENRRQDYDDAIDFLKGVRDGKNTLGENDPDGTPSDANDVQIAGPDRVFDRDSLEGF